MRTLLALVTALSIGLLAVGVSSAHATGPARAKQVRGKPKQGAVGRWIKKNLTRRRSIRALGERVGTKLGDGNVQGASIEFMSREKQLDKDAGTHNIAERVTIRGTQLRLRWGWRKEHRKEVRKDRPDGIPTEFRKQVYELKEQQAAEEAAANEPPVSTGQYL